MIELLSKFKIPTLLGLAILLAGIGGGVFLVVRNQTFISQASPDQAPQNITFSNLEDSSVIVSWQTSVPTPGFVTVNLNSTNKQTLLDDRNTNTPTPRLEHFVTIKNLAPQTTYQLKIFSGKTQSDVLQFTTAQVATNQNGYKPIIGTVLDNNKPLEEGIVFLRLEGAVTQSALVKSFGNFLIPISVMRKQDLSSVFLPTENETAKLTVISGSRRGSLTFKLTPSDQPLTPLIVGRDLNLTALPATSSPKPSSGTVSRLDLNEDGLINSSDWAIILKNFGKSPEDSRADLDQNGVVDEKDLQLILGQ